MQFISHAGMLDLCINDNKLKSWVTIPSFLAIAKTLFYFVLSTDPIYIEFVKYNPKVLHCWYICNCWNIVYKHYFVHNFHDFYDIIIIISRPYIKMCCVIPTSQLCLSTTLLLLTVGN